MIKIENTKVYGLDNAIRVSKFPMAVDATITTDELTDRQKKLANAPSGSGHDNYLKGVNVQFDLTCTNKMWIEAERYHWFDIVSSQSTMHRIAKMSIEKSCCEYVTQETINIVKHLQDYYNAMPTAENYLRLLYNVPSGFFLTAGVTTNYLQLKTIYHQRKDHRLPEWREFCRWIETSLFKSYLITGDES